VRVCHCVGVGDREIRSLAREGVTDVESIGRFCHAGAQCGGCRPTIERLIADEVGATNCRLPVLRGREVVRAGEPG